MKQLVHQRQTTERALHAMKYVDASALDEWSMGLFRLTASCLGASNARAVFYAASATADLMPRMVQTIGPSAAAVRENLVPAACVLPRELKPSDSTANVHPDRDSYLASHATAACSTCGLRTARPTHGLPRVASYMSRP